MGGASGMEKLATSTLLSFFLGGLVKNLTAIDIEIFLG